MTKEQVLDRARHLKRMLDRAERNAGDCHVVDNVRNTLRMLIELMETDCSPDTAEDIVKRAENKATEIFMKRYGPDSQPPKKEH